MAKKTKFGISTAPRAKPKKRPGRHKKSPNKHEKRMGKHRRQQFTNIPKYPIYTLLQKGKICLKH